MRWVAIGDVDVTSSQRSRGQEGSGLDAVGNDAVPCASKLERTFYPDCGCARAFDVCPHFIEQIGQVGDLRLAGTVLHDGFAIRKGGGHEKVFRASNGDFIEHDLRASEAVRRRFDVAVVLRNLCAETFESLDVQIDRPGSYGASARQGNPGSSTTGDE